MIIVSKNKGLILSWILVLSLFSIIRFANSFCYGSNGLNGTCYTSAECSSKGGTASGTCAQGFGVCCTSKFKDKKTYWFLYGPDIWCTTNCTCSFTNDYWWNFHLILHGLVCLTSCGQTATVNNTYWANPGYSSTYSTAGQCSLTVKKCASNICQIR